METVKAMGPCAIARVEQIRTSPASRKRYSSLRRIHLFTPDQAFEAEDLEERGDSGAVPRIENRG